MRSPCNKKCRLKYDICLSCFRSMDEITKWRYCNREEKEQIMENANFRKQNLEEPYPSKRLPKILLSKITTNFPEIVGPPEIVPVDPRYGKKSLDNKQTEE